MKKFPIVIILVSSLVNSFVHLLNLIDINIAELQIFRLLIDAFMRYGDLTFIFGFVGLFLIIHQDLKIKWLVFAIVTMGFLRFFLIEFSLVKQLSVLSTLLLFVQMSILIIFVLRFRDKELLILTQKSYILIGLTILYCMGMLVALLLNAQPQVLIQTIISTFYLGFQIGLWLFFKQWYKEAFISKNMILLKL